jgi:hypothetical protein
MIDHGQARRIASEWHGGGGTALYAFVSTGTVSADMRAEVRADLETTHAPESRQHYTEADRRELRALSVYARIYDGQHMPQGWANVWSDAPIEDNDL